MHKPEYAKQQLRNFGRKLMQKRIEKGIRREDLADMASVNELTIRRIEQGSNVTLVSVFKIAKAINVEPGEMFYW